jgi:hypothetical protein
MAGVAFKRGHRAPARELPHLERLVLRDNLKWDFFDDIIDAFALGRSIKQRVTPRLARKQGNRPV